MATAPEGIMNLEEMSREELLEEVKKLLARERERERESENDSERAREWEVARVTRLERTEAEVAVLRGEEERLRKRFEHLDRASLALGRALTRLGVAPEREFYQVIVDEARPMVDAEFCALGVGDDPERVFELWVYSGISPPRAAAIGRHPRPRGVLGLLTRTEHPIRLRDLRQHAEFSGFPTPHPEMRSLLGVPIRFGDRIVGNLYLSNKLSAEEFSEEDQRVLEMFAERVGVAMEIARLGREVRTAVEARDNLLAIVSHDLRGPLSAIQLRARLLTQKFSVQNPEQNRKQLDAILRSVERMTRLIEDLLQAATIESGKFTVAPGPERVATIVAQALEALDPLAAAKSVHLQTEISRALPPVCCDRQRLIQVLWNLIGNAIKFVGEGGTVGVRAWVQDGEVQFAVSDNGPGIPEEQLEHLFDRYWKGAAREPLGVGLGLFIAKGIIQAHGGRMWVESRVGEGSTFYFTIPIAGSVERHAPVI